MAESPWGVNIDMDQFTTNVVTNADQTVTGSGIFDILMNTATQHITAQYEAGRIRGEDYATTYIQIYQASLAAAVQIWTQKPVAELQRESEGAKKDLYYRQIQGFDENYKQQLLKIMLDAWSVGFSVARDSFLNDIPGPMQKQSIDDLFNNFIMGSVETFKYGRSEETINRGVNMNLEEVIKNAQTTIDKLTAVNDTVPAASKTTPQKNYDAAQETASTNQITADIAKVPTTAE